MQLELSKSPTFTSSAVCRRVVFLAGALNRLESIERLRRCGLRE